MARKLVVNWQEDAETLRRRYHRERDGQHRTRLHALWLLRSGKTLNGVAAALGVGQRTVQNWVGWYREGGLERGGSKRRLSARGSAAGT